MSVSINNPFNLPQAFIDFVESGGHLPPNGYKSGLFKN